MAYGFTNIVLSRENFRLKNFYKKRFDRSQLAAQATDRSGAYEIDADRIHATDRERLLRTIHIVSVFLVAFMLAAYLFYALMVA